MNIFDSLRLKKLKPKQETVLFLLQFSKGLAVVKNKKKTFLISKN